MKIPVFVGTMGWSNADWNGVFYPNDTAARDMIAVYARAFQAVEIDSTFYGTPPETTVKRWKSATPEHFVFCPKVPRAITHDAGLVDVLNPLREFTRTMALLGAKRGPMLLQMPPDFTCDQLPALRDFLPILTEMQDPAARFAIEFRHRSLLGEDVAELLRAHNVAQVAADYAPMPKRFTPTADFAYLRLIGRHGAFESHREIQADRGPDIEKWASAIRDNADKFQAAYVFCNNDYEGYSPATCNTFRRLVGQETVDRPPEAQGSLF